MPSPRTVCSWTNNALIKPFSHQKTAYITNAHRWQLPPYIYIYVCMLCDICKKSQTWHTTQEDTIESFVPTPICCLGIPMIPYTNHNGKIGEKKWINGWTLDITKMKYAKFDLCREMQYTVRSVVDSRRYVSSKGEVFQLSYLWYIFWEGITRVRTIWHYHNTSVTIQYYWNFKYSAIFCKILLFIIFSQLLIWDFCIICYNGTETFLSLLISAQFNWCSAYKGDCQEDKLTNTLVKTCY